MNKKKTPSPWDGDVPASTTPEADPTPLPRETIPNPGYDVEEIMDKVKAVQKRLHVGYDMEGLMSDFPTATELQKFVYDRTGLVLDLKGRPNKVKYQIALDALNGIAPASEFLGSENPYLDKNEVIPEEPLRELPPRDPAIAAAGPEVTRFGTNVFPHPDPDWRASDQKAQVVFRKYATGIITYEILGPIAQRAVGTKINKFGKPQPEKIVWIDPRTGEQIIRRSDGSFTPLGTRLRSFMQRQRVNKSNQWDTWIDRDFIAADNMIIDNPWG
jgi:hypothetical protein